LDLWKNSDSKQYPSTSLSTHYQHFISNSQTCYTVSSQSWNYRTEKLSIGREEEEKKKKQEKNTPHDPKIHQV